MDELCAKNAMNANCTILHTGYVSPHPTWSVRWHKHTYNELIIIEQGRHLVNTQDSGQCSTTAGDVLLYPPEWWHEDVSDPQSPVGMFYIGFHGNAGRHFTKVHDRGGRIRTLVRWLYDASHLLQNHNASLCAAFFLTILKEFENLKNLPEESSLVELVRAHVLKEMDKSFSLEVLAREAKLSVRHFIRRYRAETGVSPMVDVRRIRLEYARDMYVRTILPLKAIAPRVGYNSEHELSKAFRKHFGYPLAQLKSRKMRRPCVRACLKNQKLSS